VILPEWFKFQDFNEKYQSEPCKDCIQAIH
jgi:hypothetical protein